MQAALAETAWLLQGATVANGVMLGHCCLQAWDRAMSPLFAGGGEDC